MYVVTRTFRDANGVFAVGSIVDPTTVKTFRSRLQQRHIVDVDERNVDEWARYFKNRHGIDLSERLKAYLEAQPEPEEPKVDDSREASSVPTPPEAIEEPVVEASEEEQTSSEEDESW